MAIATGPRPTELTSTNVSSVNPLVLPRGASLHAALNGTISNKLENLTNLILFDVSSNRNLQGDIPSSLCRGQGTKLTDLVLSSTQLTGGIEVLRGCSDLIYLDISVSHVRTHAAGQRIHPHRRP